MNNKILVLNCSPVIFTNKETGEVREMCKLTYGVFVEETENFIGYGILEGYVKSGALDVAKKYICKLVEAKIRMLPQKNGFKYIITSINNESFESSNLSKTQ